MSSRSACSHQIDPPSGVFLGAADQKKSVPTSSAHNHAQASCLDRGLSLIHISEPTRPEPI
eukprot:6499060-Pyramimonas_sp.AAC.1